MSVIKTYQIVIEYERGDVGQKGTSPPRTRGAEEVDYEVAALSESDHAYKELQKIVLKRIQNVVPVSQGITSAHIVGEVSES